MTHPPRWLLLAVIAAVAAGIAAGAWFVDLLSHGG